MSFRRIAGILLLLLMVIATRLLSAVRELDLAAEATMALGFVLVVSFFVGRVASRIGLPSITGYLAVGVLFGPHVFSQIAPELTILTKQTVRSLQLLDGAALGLIALTAGGELELATVRARQKSILSIISAHVSIVTIGVAGAIYALAGQIPAFAGFSPTSVLAGAVMLGVISVAKSPATTIAVIQEYKSRGPVTEVVLAVTVAKDIVVVTVFTVALAVVLILSSRGEVSPGQLVLGLVWEVAGSLLLGVGVGVVLAWYLDRARKEVALVVLGIAFLSGGLTESYHLSGLLMCMVAGFYVENFSDHGADLIHAVERHSLPLYIIFFTIAGGALDLEALRGTWMVALGLVVLRTFFTFVATYLGARFSGESAAVQKNAWTGFIGQAGVTLGFAAIIGHRLPDIGPVLKTVIIAAVALNQIIGPILFRFGLQSSGEIPDPNAPARVRFQSGSKQGVTEP